MHAPAAIGAHALPILKGPAFAARLAEVCAGALPSAPLPGRRYHRILVPGLCGGEVQFALLGLLATALRIRGAEVTALMCDKLLPACTLRKADHHESACTRWCYRNAVPFAEAARLPHRWYGDLLTGAEQRGAAAIALDADPAGIFGFTYRGIELGEHVLRSLESFFKVGSVDLGDPVVADKAREFLLSAMYLVHIGERALDELAIDKVLLEDGKKTDWGVIRAVARKRGIPVDLVLVSPRGRHLMVEWDRPGTGTGPGRFGDAMPGWPIWRDQPLTALQEAELDAYLLRREEHPIEGSSFRAGVRRMDLDQARRLVGLPANRPSGDKSLVFAMFPNVGYDAGLGAERPAFATAAEWIERTVEYFRGRPEHHLVIKVHPGEPYLATRDSALDRLRRAPGNVHVVPPDSPLTARRVVELADIALVYTSTVAVEAAAAGAPVILVGGGWHAGRGVTIDVRTPKEYFDRLGRLCDGTEAPEARREYARRYAYAFFFRAACPIGHFTIQDFDIASIDIADLGDLAPGRDAALDAICRSILLDQPPGTSEEREHQLPRR